MSWRMMLRSKTGNCEFTLKDVQNNTTIPIDLKIHFTQNQINSIVKNPDMIWQAAQYFRKYYEKEGIARPEIYVNCMISLNGSEHKPLINNKIS